MAPELPAGLPCVNAERLSMADQLGHPALIEFWDFCRPNSMRTLPYVKAWHARYGPAGLRVIGVHSAGFEPSGDPDNVRAAVARLGIEYPVLIDLDLVVWRRYENLGWPVRYLFDAGGQLYDYHYGEGAYEETERAICELLGTDAQPLEPIHPEDATGAQLALQSDDVPGAYSGPYEAGGVWAVLDGAGAVHVGEREIVVEHPGAYLLIEHGRSTTGVLELSVGEGVRCLAVCFTPGLAGPGVTA